MARLVEEALGPPPREPSLLDALIPMFTLVVLLTLTIVLFGIGATGFKVERIEPAQSDAEPLTPTGGSP